MNKKKNPDKITPIPDTILLLYRHKDPQNQITFFPVQIKHSSEDIRIRVSLFEHYADPRNICFRHVATLVGAPSCFSERIPDSVFAIQREGIG